MSISNSYWIFHAIVFAVLSIGCTVHLIYQDREIMRLQDEVRMMRIDLEKMRKCSGYPGYRTVDGECDSNAKRNGA